MPAPPVKSRSEEHTSELQSRLQLVCRLLLEKKKAAEHTNPDRQEELVIEDSADLRGCDPGQPAGRDVARLAGGSPPDERFFFGFFFNDTATTEIYTLSLHDALPIYFIIEMPSRLSRLFRPSPSRYSMMK